MIARIDPGLCIGCGLCPQVCPVVFRLEEDKAVADPAPVPPEHQASCRQAAADCPVNAIAIQE